MKIEAKRKCKEITLLHLEFGYCFTDGHAIYMELANIN